MKTNSRFFKCLTLPVLALALQASASPCDHSSVRLSGHVPCKAVSDAQYLHRLDAATNVQVTFVLPLRDKKALEELVHRIYDPTDEEYGKFLTTQEFAERFAPSEEDYANVIAHAKILGLTVKGIHSNRTLLNVSGPVESIEKAFNLRLHHYQKSDGRIFYAPDNDPEVPSDIASIIHGIVGLDNHAERHTYNRRKEIKGEFSESHQTSHAHPSGPNGGYSPNDIQVAYNLTGVSAKGSNQIIAMFELGSYKTSDITQYAKHFGLPAPK